MEIVEAVTTHTIASRIRRCPACGQRIQSTTIEPRCPLCNFGFGDDRVTSADVTPYARAFSRGEPGRRRMAEWVCYAGGERLKHLALMRASAASRRFSRVNILLLAAGLGLFQATSVGWRWVTNAAAIEPTGSTEPAGRGWFHVGAVPRPLSPDRAPEIPVDLWWNPVQMVIAVVTAGLMALLLLSLVMFLLNRGVTLAHSVPYRGEQRMTAAIHYSTAWAVPMLLSLVVIELRPVSFVGAISKWSWHPPERGVVLSAAVVAAFAVTMWWFWLGRLGATAPARTRWRVITFFALGAPILVITFGALWWYGLDRLYNPLMKALDLSF